MIDAVAGQDHDRPLGRKSALDQALRQCVDERPRRPIGQLAPVAAAGALGQEQSVRVALDGGAEEAGEARMVRRQRLARTAVQAAVVGAFVDDSGNRVGDGAQRR